MGGLELSSDETSTNIYIGNINPKVSISTRILLTLNSMIAPFDAFEMSYIMVNGAFAPKGANAPFSIIFSKVFKTLLNFFLEFFFNV